MNIASGSMWLMYAVLAAVCAALVSIFGKVGMKDVNSDMATAVRSVVQAGFVVIFAMSIGAARHLGSLHRWAVASIICAGVAGGLSWIFGFRAIQLAGVAKVAPIDKLSMPLAVVLAVILLGERPSGINWAGIGLILVGVYLTTLK
ncbi:MAG: EamA family transporter [Phycisphaerae bacterium]|nr:EamA family transporter [Phycisphaerae bacterium]